MTELFKMNEYGDIWQEPSLFDQGVDPGPAPAGPSDEVMAPLREDCDAVKVIVATQGNGYLRCARPTGHDGPHRTGWKTEFCV